MIADYEENLVIVDNPIHVVAFAGDSQQQYQFGKTLRRLNLSHTLMRDSHTTWYQHGIKGIFDNFSKTSHWIAAYKSRYYVKTIGVSSGAYAALLYGQLACVDEIIAISPVTGKEVDDFDPKWHSRIAVGPGETDPSPIEDLRKFFANGTKSKIRAFISDGVGTEIDRQMAERIGIKDITLIPGYSHADLARGMRDMGVLDRILTDRVGYIRSCT